MDYLLGQGFSAYHIAQAPKILSHSLQTTKERLEEIKALGLSTNSLVILCKSKKEYAKHLKALAKCSIRESLRNKWIKINNEIIHTSICSTIFIHPLYFSLI